MGATYYALSCMPNSFREIPMNFPKGPYNEVVYTLALKYLHRAYFSGQSMGGSFCCSGLLYTCREQRKLCVRLHRGEVISTLSRLCVWLCSQKHLRREEETSTLLRRFSIHLLKRRGCLVPSTSPTWLRT